jgi:chemotaxis protein methyltransferase CheR
MSQDMMLSFFAKLIEKELGIIYSEANLFQLQTRLEEVTKTLGLSSVDVLYTEAKHGLSGVKLQVLLDVATNNETSFFRDRGVFDYLEAHILPEIFKKPSGTVKIWSTASSYGQEPYSLSMLISQLAEKGIKAPVSILATDISQRALQRAKTGRYSHLEVQRGLTAPTLLKFFKQDNEGWWKINEQEQKRVEFKTQNLLSNFSLVEQFDLVLCRNVLIYQTIESKKAIISRIARHIRPGGYFVMGTGETLMGLSDEFEFVRTGSVIIYRKLPVLQRVAV